MVDPIGASKQASSPAMRAREGTLLAGFETPSQNNRYPVTLRGAGRPMAEFAKATLLIVNGVGFEL